MTKCLPVDDDKNMWSFCPSIPAAALFAALFGLTTIAHIYQARKYRNTYCFAIIMGGLWETFSFILRPISINNPTSQGLYDPQFLLFLLAPLWINAFDYMLLGRMVGFYLPDRQLMGLRAERMAACFVGLDIVSFIIQIGGGVMTVSKNVNTINTGLHIYTGGVALQELFIFFFIYLVYTFQQKLKREGTMEKVKEARKLLIVLYGSLLLISFRILFRIIEFSASFQSALTQQLRFHEVWQYVFDAVPMFFALVMMNIFHPGMVLRGKDSEFPKRTKEEKRAVKEEKKRVKEERKREKAERKGEKRGSGVTSGVTSGGEEMV